MFHLLRRVCKRGLSIGTPLQTLLPWYIHSLIICHTLSMRTLTLYMSHSTSLSHYILSSLLFSTSRSSFFTLISPSLFNLPSQTTIYLHFVISHLRLSFSLPISYSLFSDKCLTPWLEKRSVCCPLCKREAIKLWAPYLSHSGRNFCSLMFAYWIFLLFVRRDSLLFVSENLYILIHLSLELFCN